MSWPPEDGYPYMPANGTEGMIFQEGWCAHCARDAEFRQSYEETGGNPTCSGCQIYAAAFFGEQPKEWFWRKGQPYCSAHTEDPNCPVRCPDTLEMFS